MAQRREFRLSGDGEEGLARKKGYPALFDRRSLIRFGAFASLAALAAPKSLLASTGGSRTISLYNTHSLETLTTEYWVDGWYHPDAIASLNQILRDWRTDEVTEIDFGLLDLIWQVQQRMDVSEPVHIICGYRSPKTNARLARTNQGVARNSYHIRGQAVDIRVPGRDLRGLRETAIALDVGGVGYYPRSDFVHIDTGPVRTW